MRHVPYSTRTAAAEDLVMAISATTAENTWFGGHRTNLHFGGGIYGNNDGGGIVDIIDGNGVVGGGSCTSNSNELVRSGSDVRNDSDAEEHGIRDNGFNGDVVDDDDDEVICESVNDERYGRRLLLSALTAAAVVPAKRSDLVSDKWPFRCKKSYLFKRKRRPSLSNVVEIYENATAGIATGDHRAVNKSSVISSSSSSSSLPSYACDKNRAAITPSVVGDVVENAKTNSILCGERGSWLNGGDKIEKCDNVSSLVRCAEATTAAITTIAEENACVGKRLGDVGEDRNYGVVLDSTESTCTSKTDERLSSSGGIIQNNATNGGGRLTHAKSWYGEVFSDKSSSYNNVGTVPNDCRDNCNVRGAGRRRRRTFTSLPEDEDFIVGEIGADYEERVVLLGRSVSVSNEAALSTPPAKRTTTKTTLVDDARFNSENKNNNYNGSDAKSVPLLSPSLSSATSSGNKLGKWSRSKIDLLVPSLKSLVTMTTHKLSASKPANLNCRRNSSTPPNYLSRFDICAFESSIAASVRRNISLNNLSSGSSDSHHKNVASSDNIAEMCFLNDDNASSKKLRKCNTVSTLSGCISRSAMSTGTVHIEPLRPINRLRVSPGSQDVFLASRMCSRCSSLLSMASSSRYSLNSAYGFVPVSAPSVLCKVCLNEVPLKDSWTLQHCECSYCVDCVRSYVEFEVNQGAYSISCPDAQCEKQGIILLEEIESLVSLENVEKHKRYRLNKEVEMDRSRTWCPRAGCETVCTLCSTDRCTPQSVHCPTCNMDFCSNCRAAWHTESPCKSEEAVPGVTFDSELIKCCPMCSVPIEKDEGCAQMLCKRCKHVFCWYCLASLDDDFLLRHYDKGPCKNKLGHSRASVIWHRTQVISIFAGFGILLLIASPLLLLAAPCIVCCKCRMCSSDTKLDVDDDIPEAAELQPSIDPSSEKETDEIVDNTNS